MAMRNVSKHVVRALRDACDMVLANKGRCGSDDDFVVGMAIDDSCADVAHVDLYAEYEVRPPHYEVPLREAVQIVAKHIAYAACDPQHEFQDILLAALDRDGESPLLWGDDGKPMEMDFECRG